MRRRMLALTTLAAVGALAGPTAARAGSYNVEFRCDASPQGGNHLFTASAPTPGLATSTSCPTAGGDAGGLFAGGVLGTAFTLPNGATAGWTVTAPGPWATITRLRYRRYLGQFSENSVIPALVDQAGAVVGGETCRYAPPAGSCSRGSATAASAAAVADIPVANASALTFGVRCQAVAPATVCGAAWSSQTVWFAVFAATVTITENTTPVLGAAAGELLDGGWQTGDAAVTLSASDESGIRSVRAYVDGVSTPISTALNCDETLLIPCAAADAETITVPTVGRWDGQHVLELAAVDAAGNETRSAPLTFRSDNTAPDAPLELSTDIGADWQRNATFNASWLLPDQGDGAPIADALVTLCEQTSGACEPEVTAATLTSTSAAVPRDGTWTLRTRVGDEAGHADPAAFASTTIRVDRAAPAAPTQLHLSGGSSSPTFTATWAAPTDDGLAPLALAHWKLCQGATCPLGGSTASTSFSATAPSAGEWTAHVWYEDAAGNVDADRAATASATYQPAPPDDGRRDRNGGGGEEQPPGQQPPVQQPPVEAPPVQQPPIVVEPPAQQPPGVVRKAPALRISSAVVAGRRLTIVVRAAGALSGKATVAVQLLQRGRARTVTRPVRLARGHGRVVVQLPVGARARRATLSFGGNTTFLPGKAAARVRAARKPTPRGTGQKGR